MKPYLSSGVFSNFKYYSLPLALGVITMYGLFSRIIRKKRRAALQGKVVVITGASSGIGEALAHVFYENGSKVVLASRRVSELNRVKQDLMSKKVVVSVQEPVVIELDLADLDSLDSFVHKVHDTCDHIDILINNGGVSFRGSILNTKIEVDKRIMFINYFGTVALTKAVLPQMVQRKDGHIVFISSVQGLLAIPDRSAYAASKHAMQAFGDSLRGEMHQHKIGVTVVSPGYIRTAISLNALTGSGDHHAVMDAATAAGFTPEYTAQEILDVIVAKKKELVICQPSHKLGIFIRQFAPSIYFWLMTKRANKTTL